MLTKLLKYEFRATYLRFLSAFAAYIVIGGILLTFFRGNDVLAMLVFPCGGMALAVITFITLFQRYNSNLYGQEGYLMFTLPVKGRQLLLCKLISACVWLLALFAVGLTMFFACIYAYTTPPHHILTDGFIWIGQNGLIVFKIIVNWLLELICSVLEIYFAITVSKLPIWRKLGVLMGFVAFFAINLVDGLPYFIMTKTGLVTVSKSSPQISGNGTHFSVDYLPDFITQTLSGNGIVYWVNLMWTIVFSIGVFYAITLLMDKKTSLK